MCRQPIPRIQVYVSIIMLFEHQTPEDRKKDLRLLAPHAEDFLIWTCFPGQIVLEVGTAPVAPAGQHLLSWALFQLIGSFLGQAEIEFQNSAVLHSTPLSNCPPEHLYDNI